jgi:hypothetical protein
MNIAIGLILGNELNSSKSLAPSVVNAIVRKSVSLLLQRAFTASPDRGVRETAQPCIPADKQRGRRPIFNATLRAAAGWLFFRVARSLRINLDMLVAPPASPPETLRVTMWAGLREALRAGRALKNSQLTGGQMPATYETAH